MKKIFLRIICAICFFSIAPFTFSASEQGYIEQLLDLNYGPEEYDIHLQHLTPVYFQDSRTQQMFNNFEYANELLKDQLIQKYRNGELSHNKISAIVSAHKKFVFHTDRLFYFIAMKEQRFAYSELDDAILKNYKSSRIYYKKVKNLTLRK